MCTLLEDPIRHLKVPYPSGIISQIRSLELLIPGLSYTFRLPQVSNSKSHSSTAYTNYLINQCFSVHMVTSHVFACRNGQACSSIISRFPEWQKQSKSPRSTNNHPTSPIYLPICKQSTSIPNQNTNTIKAVKGQWKRKPKLHGNLSRWRKVTKCSNQRLGSNIPSGHWGQKIGRWVEI